MTVVISNWHDDKERRGLKVLECLGTSYDARKISLYRLENGELLWLADRSVGDPSQIVKDAPQVCEKCGK